MPKFLFFYHGGHFPPEVTDGNHVAWRSWMEGLGDRVIDSGGPLQPTKTLATGGQLVTNTGSSEVTGYTIIAADSFYEALAAHRAIRLDGEHNIPGREQGFTAGILGLPR